MNKTSTNFTVAESFHHLHPPTGMREYQSHRYSSSKRRRDEVTKISRAPRREVLAWQTSTRQANCDSSSWFFLQIRYSIAFNILVTLKLCLFRFRFVSPFLQIRVFATHKVNSAQQHGISSLQSNYKLSWSVCPTETPTFVGTPSWTQNSFLLVTSLQMG